VIVSFPGEKQTTFLGCSVLKCILDMNANDGNIRGSVTEGVDGFMEWTVAIAGAVITILIVRIFWYERKNKAELLQRLTIEWGKRPDRKYDYEEFENISHYFRNRSGNRFFIDDITWNDLDMDSIFMMLNNTQSSIGESCLYDMLRNPEYDMAVLAERSRLADYFRENEKERLELQRIFRGIGRTRAISITDYVYRLKDIGSRSNRSHYVMILMMCVSAGLLFVRPEWGISCLLVSIVVSILNYYKTKAEIEPYIISLKYVMKILKAADQMEKLRIAEIEQYLDRILSARKRFAKFRRNSFLLMSGNGMGGSLADVFMDYVRMIFHVDLIKFNIMVVEVKRYMDDIECLFETIGILEATIATGSFRESLPYYAVPMLSTDKDAFLNVESIFHPLIDDPVANGISETRSVLLTGSNASGKSTFLKTLAISAILAQTVYTTPARSYYGVCSRIYSSMTLKDDLSNNESYYMAEIRSLKRILDQADSSIPVLCFIDEVLRGTNTVERIAASAQILKRLCGEHVLCFAATHDVELTHILEGYYSNYHFQEEVADGDVRFDYRIYSGRAVSRNAIKLLGIMGFEDVMIKNAEKAAEDFINEGMWTMLA